MNLISRLRSIFAGGYTAAEDTRFRSAQAWNRSTVGTEDDVLGAWDRQRLRLEARDLWRNNEIGRGIGDRFSQYVIWNGISPQAQTTDTRWNNLAEAWWNDIYVPTCDWRQLQGVDLITFQRFTVSHRVYDGDCGFVLMDNGQLLPIEADRIATPAKESANPLIVEGVQLNASGLIVGYHICPRGSGGAADTTKAQFVRRENFVHCWKPGRIDQLRGIPDLAPAINKLKDYDETDVNVFNKVKADATTLWKETTEGSGMRNERARDSYVKTDGSGKNPQKVTKGEWGTVWHGSLGEDLSAFEGKTPSSEYVPYLKHELQAISCALGISYEVLMLIFTEGSFSSQRAALIHNRHTFLTWHDWVVKTLMRRLWNWRTAKAIKYGDLPPAPTEPVFNAAKSEIGTRSQWHRVSWSLPFFDWVDPQKQSEADRLDFNMAKKSLKTIISATGQDRDDVLLEKAQDFEAAMLLAEELNVKHPGANFTWRDIISTATTAAPVTGDAK